MRSFSKVLPTFWVDARGRALRRAGRDAQLVALYLSTCPASTWTGLFYLAIPTVSHEIGMPEDDVRRAIDKLRDLGFLMVDEENEVVFMPDAAELQIGPELALGDRRIKGLERDLEPYLSSPLVEVFLARYGKAFHLEKVKPLRSPFEAPSEPLRSMETETLTPTLSETCSETEREGEREPRGGGGGCEVEPGKAEPATRTKAKEPTNKVPAPGGSQGVPRASGDGRVTMEVAVKHATALRWLDDINRGFTATKCPKCGKPGGIAFDVDLEHNRVKVNTCGSC